MPEQTYQQLIAEGIKGLPQDALAEITDFVFFVRKRLTQPALFEQEFYGSLLKKELQHLTHSEAAHLEEEFADYDRRYPRE